MGLLGLSLVSSHILEYKLLLGVNAIVYVVFHPGCISDSYPVRLAFADPLAFVLFFA